MSDFFAPRQKNRSKQLQENENTTASDKSVENASHDDKSTTNGKSLDNDEACVVAANVKTENVRRSSRLSAQAAAAAIALALQVIVWRCSLTMHSHV